MRVYVKSRYAEEMTREVIGRVLARLGLDAQYELTVERGDGRRLLIDCDGRRVYVIMSGGAADARNAFLAQYVPTVLGEYVQDRSPNKRVCVYLMDTSQGALAPFIIDTYRAVKTLGIEIINGAELGAGEITAYASFAEWKRAKEQRQRRNSNNSGSYAVDDGDELCVYGKLYGANGKDSVLMACQLARIAANEGKTLRFVQVWEHDTQRLSARDRALLEYFGVRFDDDNVVVRDRQATGERTTCRNQAMFRYNLLLKYGDKRCYLCGCDIESAIVASHIQRIVDLDNSTLDETEKRRRAVDGDNGLWLCATHDKMFEYGKIYFDERGAVALNPALTVAQREYVERITPVRAISPAHLTDGMREYLRLHRVRVGDAV